MIFALGNIILAKIGVFFQLRVPKGIKIANFAAKMQPYGFNLTIGCTVLR